MAADHTKSHTGPKSSGRVSTYAAVSQIVRERGVMGLHTGFRLHLVRDVVGSGIFFGVYEAVKQSLNSMYGVSNVNAPGAVAFAGAICGVTAWCVVCTYVSPSTLRRLTTRQTYPLDSMKTQAQNRLVGAGASQAAAEIVTTEAKKAMKSNIHRYKGFEMVVLRSAIQGMIQQSIFEEVKRLIDGSKFSDGSTTLPNIQRELGRDQKIAELQKKNGI